MDLWPVHPPVEYPSSRSFSLLPLNPRHDQIHNLRLLAFGQLLTLRYFVPLLQASSAAAGCCMHALECRVAVHGGLLPVIQRMGRGELDPYEILRMPPDRLHPFFFQIFSFLFRQMKARPKLRPFQLIQRLFNRLHVSLNKSPSVHQDSHP